MARLKIYLSFSDVQKTLGVAFWTTQGLCWRLGSWGERQKHRHPPSRKSKPKTSDDSILDERGLKAGKYSVCHRNSTFPFVSG
jgi:hypothetical protein